MSDLLSDVPPPPFAIDVGGRRVPLAELNLYDVADLLRAERTAARDRKLANCRDAGLGGEQVYTELEAFDARRWGTGELVDLVNSVDGQLAVLERSFAKTDPAEGPALLRSVHWRAHDRLRAAAHVVGLDMISPGGGDGEDDGSDPTAGRPTALTT